MDKSKDNLIVLAFLVWLCYNEAIINSNLEEIYDYKRNANVCVSK